MGINNNERRITAIQFGRAKALGQLRKAANSAIALAEVDWEELAEHYLEDVEDEVEDEDYASEA